MICLTVDRHIQRFDDTAKHLDEQGIKWEKFTAFDNQICRLVPVETFDLDRAGERISPKHVAATLSHLAIWFVMLHQPDDTFIVCEYDVRFVEGWQEQYERAIKVVPEDYDVLMLGNCCTQGRPVTHIADNVYDVRYPLCGHCIQFRKKALPTLIKEQQRIFMPLDIALYHLAFPKLKVFTVLPQIVTQHGTPTPI